MSHLNRSPDYSERKDVYPKRTVKKISTMFKIYECLPSHFNQIKGLVNLTDKTVSERLKEMLDLRIVDLEENVKKEITLKNSKTGEWVCNVYQKNLDFEKSLLKYSSKYSLEKKFGLEVCRLVHPLSMIKKRGRKGEHDERKTHKSILEEWEELKKEYSEKGAPC
jgi:DNA-binding HxlR family transcriptional regulator